MTAKVVPIRPSCDRDALGAARGAMNALPVCVLLWTLIFGLTGPLCVFLWTLFMGLIK
jgi:hypothetical protein